MDTLYLNISTKILKPVLSMDSCDEALRGWYFGYLNLATFTQHWFLPSLLLTQLWIMKHAQNPHETQDMRLRVRFSRGL